MSDLDTSIAQAYERGAAATDVQRRIAEVRGTGDSEGGLVTAVVSGAGELVDLRIAQEALRLGPGRLGEAIVAAARHATDDARQRGYTLLALALGDEAAAEVERADRSEPDPGSDTATTSVAATPAGPGTAPDLGRTTATGRSPAAGVVGPGGVIEPAADRRDTDDGDDSDDVASFDASIFRSDR